MFLQASVENDFALLRYHAYMKPIISHNSALEYWRSVRTEKRTCRPVSSAKPLLEKPPTVNLFDEASAWEFRRPLHVLVESGNTRRRSKDLVCHTKSGSLPAKAVLDTRRGFYVCSPELCFLQSASFLELSKMIELGFELCGTYDASCENLRSCNPLTTHKKLTTFITRAEGFHGRKQALRALQYVSENAASPQETLLVMLLCLPYRLGGYGLEPPSLNYRIDLSTKASTIAGKKYLVCDLYWPRAKVAVEYDSDAFHTGPKRIAQDSERRAALATMGITVITVTRKQLRSSKELHAVAHLLADHVGKPLQYKDPTFTQARLKLRAAILS